MVIPQIEPGLLRVWFPLVLAALCAQNLLLSVGMAQAVEDPQLPLWRRVSFPLEKFTRFSSRFGWRTMGGRREFHSGLDMPAPVGSPLRAWAAGTVESVRYDSRCGLHLTIASGNWRSTYCHLSATAVQLTQTVKAGQIVAAVGSSGRSTGPHLHWTLRYQGKLVNPQLVIQAMQMAWQGIAPPNIEPAQDVPLEEAKNHDLEVESPGLQY